MPAEAFLADPIQFECPRCERSVAETFYGPCLDCRGRMRAEMAGAARAVESVEYEPKMNVVPNQVASKD